MSNLTEKIEKDLIKDLREKEDSLRAFRFALSGSKTRNIKEGKALRKEIARIKTEMSRRTKLDKE